ncbi:cyclic nucleotide-binding domain-containing protein [Aestuariirhabdus sp. Z084]|uniref:cyclic nucleotide-binding domain-containing protein n=1 Tax=Aestuariirhabdus haliotis TaxID=2918751 RepID=UPI00201B3D79|nr:cyclic nucleotide-binding domain-containing protein [Aestuariirhabdus haliotis]MCL6415342.1 cyclic nucleotide-binding domain-containing protein [Aestuariirhabdus haliotis]MCL6419098.1 cyclic nucleotide-binding domain-containing protein [Aestuariirhabdus haliotis]
MASDSISLKQISRLHPMQLLGKPAQKQLIEIALQIKVKQGSMVLKKRKELTSYSYLFKGKVELRHSFDDRRLLSVEDEMALQPLEDLIDIGASIRALEECVILRFDRDFIDNLRTSSSPASSPVDSTYGVVSIEGDANYLDSSMIDDDYQEDWTLQLLDSPLARNLKPTALHRLMAKLERVDVKLGDQLIEQGQRADYFYILISGEAALSTDLHGPFNGQTINLSEGTHFGEEALLGDTLRNATIKMTSDGVVGRLNRQQFLEVFSESLLPTLPEQQFNQLLEQEEIACLLLDVRFREELRDDTRENVLNIPISRLRSALPQLNRGTTYLLSAQGGPRSELACCILRQHDFSAFLQAPVEQPETKKTA